MKNKYKKQFLYSILLSVTTISMSIYTVLKTYDVYSAKQEEKIEISNRINEAKRKQQALSDIESGYEEWYVSKKSGYESGSEALETMKSESRKYEVDFIGKQSIEEDDNKYTISIETIGKLVNTLEYIDTIEKISYTKHKYVEISYDDGQTRAKLQYVISKTPKK